MPRHALAPTLLLLGSLALTAACATGSPPADSAPSVDGPSRTGGNDTGTQVDLSKLKGVNIVSDSSTDRSCPWATSYPDVPGADAMTAAMKKDVERRLAVFLGEDTGGQATGCGGMDGLEGPELNVSFSFLVASGDVLGVRLGTVDRTSNADGLATEAYWYDGAAKEYRPSPGLIADGSRDAFVSAVKKRLEKREGVTPDTVAALDDQESRDVYLDDMAFTADGDLKVDFDRGTVGVPPAGRISVTLPKATVTPWLSDFGSRAQQQTTDPDDKLDLGAVHTPAPTVAAQPDPGEDTTDCSQVKCIALTFDDGPAAPETGTLLTYLAQYKARATFFVVGQNVAAHPDIVRAEMKSGHEIANHSWNHPVLTNLTPTQIRSQLERTNAAIKAATGKEPTLFRPPYGAIDGNVRAATSLSPVLWDMDTLDWKSHDPAKVAQTVISQAEPNDVVLIHDIHPTSVAAVPEILRTLTGRGYHFVTTSHLRATM
ncbi:polysaccharide deacetylase family protein [Streptomyces caelestis]|uniref:Peptidoglycan/xylan/chitin deacetylase (PgdA/CDA1 family) n=1 Tax=Streptomyces caelestis TaxID=36816 RepID=A0A7W9LX14_9ACTN|nr:polysaccharide deacetylase family protein [Streptomyces caelestis]MBB5799390.1 peptidoglycan/xylan/chitin deacetylase (PgdA/CDA1 family) [Streptomyces caelestis]GGW45368.1 hypothetical protein GCM10010320_26690 [Streptomyces caelestis]